MSNEPNNERTEADAELEREIRRDRKFSLGEAIGRLGGPGMMKGASPVARKRQAEMEIEEYLRQNLTDGSGALRSVLLRQVKESKDLLENYEQPLVVLAAHLKAVLGSEYRLKELVREADAEWGRIVDERPHFEQEGRPPHCEDPYTEESVHKALSVLGERLVRGE